MAIYRFRVTYEDHEDVFRDIEIKSTQTFEDFHRVIQEAISFDNSKPAIWYTSDDYWRRDEEIGVVNDADTKEKKAIKTKLAEHIDDPHQKFLYIFDPEKEWTFWVELMKIILEDRPNAVLPMCVKTSGTAPKQYKATSLPPPPEDGEEEEEDKTKEKEKVFVADEEFDAEIKEDQDAPIIDGDDELPDGEVGEDEPPAEDVEE